MTFGSMAVNGPEVTVLKMGHIDNFDLAVLGHGSGYIQKIRFVRQYPEIRRHRHEDDET
jgi:hypothetical protein